MRSSQRFTKQNCKFFGDHCSDCPRLQVLIRLAEENMKVWRVQVREFQAVIGKETRQQCMEQFGGKPDICLACVGGGSNAIGGVPPP